MRGLLLVCAALAAVIVAGPAQGAFIEIEPNNSIATATAIPAPGPVPWADVGVVSLAVGGGDVDYFAVTLAQGNILTAVTTPIAPMFTGPDTLLGLFDGGATLLVMDDDSGNSGGSAGSTIQWYAVSSGTYYLAVTGAGDAQFTGGHTQEGAYILTLSVVPEPASLLALAAGLPMLLLRRRR
jgi:hypothetical protein